MTKLKAGKCEWCRRPFALLEAGRPRRYCRQSCRQRSYESRLLNAQLGLSENELVITRQALESLLDQVYVLQAAVEDVERDLARSNDPAEVRRCLDWLLECSRPVASTPLL